MANHSYLAPCIDTSYSAPKRLTSDKLSSATLRKRKEQIGEKHPQCQALILAPETHTNDKKVKKVPCGSNEDSRSKWISAQGINNAKQKRPYIHHKCIKNNSFEHLNLENKQF